MRDRPHRQIRYLFDNNKGQQFTYVVDIDANSMSIVLGQSDPPPDWTLLHRHQCKHCPLSSSKRSHCPAAVAIAPAVEAFDRNWSSEDVKVTVETPERSYSAQVQLQDGLQSLLGLILATSNCPQLDFLKPLARFHMPFASIEESSQRAVSFYLLRQYFKRAAGKPADFDLDYMRENYQSLQKVNIGMLERIRSVSTKDAGQNAIVVLDSFAQLVTFELDGGLSNLQSLFEPPDDSLNY